MSANTISPASAARGLGTGTWRLDPARSTAPTPGANEVLARGLASSVNPVDDGIAAGIATDIFAHQEYIADQEV